MTVTIEVREYGTASAALDANTASALAAAAKDRLRVSVDGGNGIYRIEASQYVGSVVVPGATVLIRPKVSIENVLLLMEAIDAPEWRDEEFAWDSHSGLLPAFAGFFARTLERTLRVGVYHAYRAEEDRLPTIRGRIDIVAQLRQPGVLVPIACRFDEYTADVLENRILKAALLRLTRTPGVPVPIHRRLRYLWTLFEDVTDVHVDPDAITRVHLHRLNQRYEPALRLAELVLRDLSVADRHGKRVASGFLIDMNHLFQEFVAARLRRLLRRRLDVVVEPPVHLSEGRKVRMYPDLVFSRHGTPVLVGDTKYKLLGNQLGRNADYYQMLAYTTALDLVEGVLIYATEDDGPSERVIQVIHADKRLWTYRLDLGGDAKAVAESVLALGNWVCERADQKQWTIRATA